MAFDETNTAIVFVENGLFNKEGVEALGSKPVIVVNVNIDGVKKEISLWFSKDKASGQYNLTQNGNKMLTGKVSDPYNGDRFAGKSATEAPVFEDTSVNSQPPGGDGLPF